MTSQSNIDALIGRLNACFGQLSDAQADAKARGAQRPVLAELQQQGLIYAGFLTDLKSGRIRGEIRTIQESVSLVERYCELIETELPTSAKETV